jgi:dethiobiotin synthetase
MAQSFLITGTDTGVGKTTVAGAIAAALNRRGRRVAVSKPVETGCEPGADGELIAPDARLLRWVRAVVAGSDVALVEGAGGLLVPLNASSSFADLARICGLRLLVVVGNRLGAINHARLTLDWARSGGLPLAGYVVNTLQAEGDLATQTNVAALRELCGPALGVFPHLGPFGRSDADRTRLADAAERSIDLDALLADG